MPSLCKYNLHNKVISNLIKVSNKLKIGMKYL